MLKDKSFTEIQNLIKQSCADIEKLNKQQPMFEKEQVFGDIYDNHGDNIVYDNIEEKWMALTNSTEEELKVKKAELKMVMESIQLVETQLAEPKLFKINVGKILGYNQVNKLYFEKINGRSTPIMAHTDAGKAYQYKIAQEVKRLEIAKHLKPKPVTYKIRVEAFVDYAQKDIDGLKAFVDCLVRALGEGDRATFDDSQFWDVEIFKLKASYKNKGKEFFLVEFVEVNDTIMKEKGMYARYVKQQVNKYR